jgi:hypothetical protein
MNNTEIMLLTQAKTALDLHFRSKEKQGLETQPESSKRKHTAWYDRVPKPQTGPLVMPQTGPLSL